MTPLSAMGPVDIYGPDTFTIDHFSDGMLAAIAGTTFLPHDETDDQLHERYRGTCAAFSAIPTRDPLDQMLAAQAVGAHNAIMESFRRAMAIGLDARIAVRLRNSAVSLSRMMRDLVRTIQQRAKDAMPLAPAEPKATGIATMARAGSAEREGPARPAPRPTPPDAMPAVCGNNPIHREEPAFRAAATADQPTDQQAPDQWHDPIRPEDPPPSPAAATPLGQTPAGQPETAREGQHPMQPENGPNQPVEGSGHGGGRMRGLMSRRIRPSTSVADAYAAAHAISHTTPHTP